MRAVFALALLALAACGGDPAPQVEALTPDGIGPIHVGETLEKLTSDLAPRLKLPANIDPKGCFFAPVDGAPERFLMFKAGALQRIDLRDIGPTRTDAGIAIGDLAEKVLQTYGDKVDIQPHKYDYAAGAQYLTVFSENKKRAIRYVTAGGKIAAIQAGNAEHVQYVEGCG